MLAVDLRRWQKVPLGRCRSCAQFKCPFSALIFFSKCCDSRAAPAFVKRSAACARSRFADRYAVHPLLNLGGRCFRRGRVEQLRRSRPRHDPNGDPVPHAEHSCLCTGGTPPGAALQVPALEPAAIIAADDASPTNLDTTFLLVLLKARGPTNTSSDLRCAPLLI